MIFESQHVRRTPMFEARVSRPAPTMNRRGARGGQRVGMRRRRKLRRRGFTLVEVMTATVILVACAAGIMALQTTVTRANMIAREIATASAIAGTWEERIKLDAMRWVESADREAMLARTHWLHEVNDQPDQWIIPDAADGMQDGFTYTGLETAIRDEERFCVNLRMNWHRDSQAGALVRVDIRVWSFADGEGRIVSGGGAQSTGVDLAAIYADHCEQANLAVIDLPEPASDASDAQRRTRRNFRIFQTTVNVRQP